MTHAPTGAAWLVWLETTGLADAMRKWLWLYPVVEIVHIVGFVVLVGAAVTFDLRLLGVSPGLRASAMARHHLSWARGALALVVPSGVLMFMAHATEFAANPAFRVKLILLAAIGLNALVLHRGAFRSVAAWEAHAPVPGRARGGDHLGPAVDRCDQRRPPDRLPLTRLWGWSHACRASAGARAESPS